MNENVIVGVDVGGTAVKFGFFTPDGALLHRWSMDTDRELTGEKLIHRMVQSIQQEAGRELTEGDRLRAVGMGVPGSVNEAGIVTYAPNVGWSNLDAAGIASKLLGVPVAIQNDANVAALGELWAGGGKGRSSLCMITLGTGVGGGLIWNGKIITGFAGCGGELGHMTVNPHETVACSCGRKGCLEQYASATGIARMAAQAMAQGSGKDSLLSQWEQVTAKEVFDAAKSGDPLGLSIVERFGTILGRALANVACVFNPECFLIGGGVSKAGDIVIESVERHFRENAYADCGRTEFCLATLGNDAGIYGGAYLAMS